MSATNYATMIKRKNNNVSPTQLDMNLNDSAYLTTQSDDSNQADYTSSSLMQPQQQTPTQYEDMLDVQVIAKMQEESKHFVWTTNSWAFYFIDLICYLFWQAFVRVF